MERRSLNLAVGRSLTTEDIFAGMLRFKENWFTVSPAILKMQNKLPKPEKPAANPSREVTHKWCSYRASAEESRGSFWRMLIPDGPAPTLEGTKQC